MSNDRTKYSMEYWTVTSGDLTLKRQPMAQPAVTDDPKQAAKIVVDPTLKKQDWIGAGAAVTDSAASLIWGVQDPAQRDALLHELFDPAQGGFSTVRVPLGSCDFSSQEFYTYDDIPFGEQDFKLEKFSLGVGTPGAKDATKDLKYIVPVLQAILKINPAVKIVASPWSSPAWMKNTGHLTHGGRLRFGEFTGMGFDPHVDSFEGVYANYFARYIEEYNKLGIPIYAVTVQNEPGIASHWPAMIWTLEQQAEFASEYLRYALDQKFPDTKIFINDENLFSLAEPLRQHVSPDQAANIDGFAVHTYSAPYENLSNGTRSYRDWQFGMTERRCMMTETPEDASHIMFGEIGNWLVRNGLNFITLWNLALDERGLPNASDSTGRRGVVTIDHTTGKVQRNLEYYMLRNFGQDVPAGSTVVQSSTYTIDGKHGGVGSVAFTGPEGDMTIHLYNPTGEALSAAVTINGEGSQWQVVEVPAWGTVTCHKANHDINTSSVPTDDEFELNPSPANNFKMDL